MAASEFRAGCIFTKKERANVNKEMYSYFLTLPKAKGIALSSSHLLDDKYKSQSFDFSGSIDCLLQFAHSAFAAASWNIYIAVSLEYKY